MAHCIQKDLNETPAATITSQKKMSSPNSVATAILANTTNENNRDGLGSGLHTPLTSRSLLSVSIGNATESMASSIISPRTRGRWDRRISDVETSLSQYSPTAPASAAPAASAAALLASSWLTSDDDHGYNVDQGSVRSSVLDTRPFPSFGQASSIAPDSSYYSQIGRFQGVRNSVSLAQPWRRRKDSTTTGSYTTTTTTTDSQANSEYGDGDGDASTISGSRHELPPAPPPPRERQQQQQLLLLLLRRQLPEQDERDAAVDLFSQHQFIMPKPDETTPLILSGAGGAAAGDVENGLNPGDPGGASALNSSLATFPSHRSRLLRRLVFACLVGVVVVGVLLVVMMRPPPAAR